MSVGRKGLSAESVLVVLKLASVMTTMMIMVVMREREDDCEAKGRIAKTTDEKR